MADDNRLEAAFKRMGEPSWLILYALEAEHAIPGIEIIRRVERLLDDAGYPTRKLDPSTLHYALKRMEEDGLVARRGKQEVEVPGPRGTTRHEMREVYVVSALGEQALKRRERLDAARLAALRTGWANPLVQGV